MIGKPHVHKEGGRWVLRVRLDTNDPVSEYRGSFRSWEGALRHALDHGYLQHLARFYGFVDRIVDRMLGGLPLDSTGARH